MSKIKSKVPRTKIKDAILNTLWGIAAGRCELCNRPLYKDQIFAQADNFSQIAHIHAVSQNGPRHVAEMTDSQINHIKNLMLLCYDHHHAIDMHPSEFTGDLLILRKQEHEKRVYEATNIGDMRKCTMLAYFNNIDSNPVIHDEELFRLAIIKSGYYPGLNRCIDLSDQSFAGYQADKTFFEEQARKLDQQFLRAFSDIVKNGEIVAIFALASQALLIKLGTLINDKYNAIPFQCHREGDKWAWKDHNSHIEFQITYPDSCIGDVCALVIDLSAKVVDDRIRSVTGDIPIIHISIENPNRTFVKNEAIQHDFICKFREVLEFIKNIGSMRKIMLFPVMPNSLAIKLGMDFMHKTDLPMTIFEQGKAGEPFFETITVGVVK